eukprot:4783768-Alexandrium_andersonii.AAC.1
MSASLVGSEMCIRDRDKNGSNGSKWRCLVWSANALGGPREELLGNRAARGALGNASEAPMLAGPSQQKVSPCTN